MPKIELACIIDDDPIFIFGTRKIMEMAGFCNSFMVFHNGKDALDALEPILRNGERLPDVILLDLNMPILDGWGFLDSFIRIPSDKKMLIYIVTSSVDPEDMARVQEYDEVSNYIIKPISADDLKFIMQDIYA